MGLFRENFPRASRMSPAYFSFENGVFETPTTPKAAGRCAPSARLYRAGSSFLWARSPLAPKTTTAQGSGDDSARSPARSGFGTSSCSGEYGISALLDRVAAELVAEGGLDLGGEGLLLPGGEPPRGGEDPPCREANRPRSDSVITGAGTFWSTAAWTVQRPSPLSSTYPLIACRRGSFSKASARRSSSQERTTLPCIQVRAIPPRSRSGNGDDWRISKPSPYAAMSPYSIPLCTIFT